MEGERKEKMRVEMKGYELPGKGWQAAREKQEWVTTEWRRIVGKSGILGEDFQSSDRGSITYFFFQYKTCYISFNLRYL